MPPANSLEAAPSRGAGVSLDVRGSRVVGFSQDIKTLRFFNVLRDWKDVQIKQKKQEPYPRFLLAWRQKLVYFFKEGLDAAALLSESADSFGTMETTVYWRSLLSMSSTRSNILSLSRRN